MSLPSPSAVCFGEILFDRYADGDHLGGAPLNFALYLRQFGVSVAMVSAVGDDELGQAALRSVRQAGVDDTYVSRRREPTGIVDVILSKGQPDYTIREGVAWDHISLPEGAIPRGDLLYFGTVAQRTQSNRATLRRLLDGGFAHRFFDVNLRRKCFTEAVVLDGLSRSTAVKMNEEEWEAIRGMANVTTPADLMRTFGPRVVIITRAEKGASLCHDAGSPSGASEFSARSAPVPAVDAVGAGDTFSAVMAAALVRGLDLERALQIACDVGAFVVSRRGAIVELPAALRESLR